MNAVDLSGMLADYTASGAYFVDESGRASIIEAAQRLELDLVVIDLQDCRDKEQALGRIAESLDFPHWFGNNWDALSDALGDLSWRPAPGYVLLVDHARDWQENDQVGFEVLLEIGNEVAAQWAEHGVPFWLLIPAASGQLAPG